MTKETKKTRATLLQRIKDPEDEAAWYEFHQFYWDLIISWARMNGCSESLAKDVFQECMVNLIHNIPSFEYNKKKGFFRSYLKTIVLRRVRDAFRREGKYIAEGQDREGEERLSSSKLHNIPDPNASEDTEMDRVWVKTALSQALKRTYASVDPLTYKSFCLHVLDGLPVAEVAEKLGIDRERNIYEHKRRVMEILKREFKEVIEDMEGPETSAIDDNMFKNALEDILEGESEHRMTMVMDTEPIKMFEQMSFLKDKLVNINIPPEEGVFLIALSGDGSFSKLDEKLVLGRDTTADLVLDKDGVSGMHATIFKTKRGWVIKDENSTNGVFVNGEKVNGEIFLKNGDLIQVTSSFQFVFLLS